MFNTWSLFVDNFKDLYWNMSPGNEWWNELESWTVPPPWKLYFNPSWSVILNRLFGTALDNDKEILVFCSTRDARSKSASADWRRWRPLWVDVGTVSEGSGYTTSCGRYTSTTDGTSREKRRHSAYHQVGESCSPQLIKRSVMIQRAQWLIWHCQPGSLGSAVSSPSEVPGRAPVVKT